MNITQPHSQPADRRENRSPRRPWSPYLVGALIGVLSWITFAGMGKALGTSTTMVHVAGLATGVVAPDHVAENAYYSKYLNADAGKNAFNWQFFLVIGLAGGALIAARLFKDTHVETVPALWSKRFGPGKAKRYAAAFAGGVLLLFGARMAGGCTSGHGISGGLQLAVSSWMFFVAMFVSGVAAAFLMFGKERNHVVH